MKLYTMLAKEFLVEYTAALRKDRDLTQEEMAERLRITSQAYGDLEVGVAFFLPIHSFWAVSPVFFLFYLLDLMPLDLSYHAT